MANAQELIIRRDDDGAFSFIIDGDTVAVVVTPNDALHYLIGYCGASFERESLEVEV